MFEQDFYERLQNYCARQFNDENCADIVGDFLINKVYKNPDFYPDHLKNSSNIGEKWAWTVSCFRRYRIDRMRYEKPREAINSTALPINGWEEIERTSLRTKGSSKPSVFVSKEQFKEELNTDWMDDEQLSIYRSFTGLDKDVYELLIFSMLDSNEITEILKEDYEGVKKITKRDVVLSIDRIKKRLRK